MEIKRLLSRKVLLAGILIYLFQAVAFIGVQIDNTGLEEIFQQRKQYHQLIAELSKMPVSEGLHVAEQKLAENRNTVTLGITEKLTYLDGYKDKIDTIFVNAENLKEFSIFQNKNSYSYANTVKTAEDFKNMQGVSLFLDRDLATQQVLAFSYVSFFVFAFMIYVLYEILRERDNGMWAVTHAMKRGRSVLAFNRGVALAVITVIFYFLCFITNLLISCLFYGMDHFGGLIQTIQAYAKYPQPLSKGAYLCVFGIKSSFALIAIVMLSYLVFTLLRSRNLAVVVLIAGFGGEWQLMQSIPVFSNLKMLRYINLMRIFDCTSLDREYQNLNVFGKAVSASGVLLGIEVILLAVCLGFAIFIYEKQYLGKTAWFDKLLGPIKMVFQKILEDLPLGLKEVYKILVSKRGMLFLLSGLLVCIWIFEKTMVYFPELQQDMDATYLSYGGSNWEEFNSYVGELEEQYQQKNQKADEMIVQIRAGILEPEKISEVSILKNQASSIFIFLKEYNRKQELRQTIEQDKEIHIYAMSDRGYSEIIGPNSKLREGIIGIIIILLSIILASQIFGYETKSHMKPLLKGSFKGITWIWRIKILCITSIVGAILIIFCGVNYLALTQIYDTPYLEAPIQSLTFLSENTARVSILQFIVLNMAFKLTLPICAVASVLLISASSKVVNQMYVPLLIVAFAILHVIIMTSNIVWLLLAGVIISLLFTMICIIGSYRKWCR